MAGIGKTIADLSAFRSEWAQRAATLGDGPVPNAGHLAEVQDFGSNPGQLRMLTFVPDRLPEGAPLVVVLHGCTQTAAGYDVGAGWSTLAKRYGFALLLPEQRRTNNPKNCFSWFLPEDTQRGRGEALSIRQMIERMATDQRIDRSRIFVTGLSAGGAMTSVMLATYPEVFAGGAIVAGLPYGAAATVAEAFESMFQGKIHSAVEWGGMVRSACRHDGDWPRISVWHGSADETVKPINAGEIVKQWTDVHGLPTRPSRRETVDGFPRRVWCDAQGNEVIEEYTITGMAHGTPLAPGSGESNVGTAGPFLLDVGISSSYHIAKFWGLTVSTAQVDRPIPPLTEGIAEEVPPEALRAFPGEAPPRSGSRPDPDDQPFRQKAGDDSEGSQAGRIERIITSALRTAGLMK
jgi:poly(hydroxyalkanoate) depolymerase family esterase